MSMTVVRALKEHIIKSLEKNVRFDGRKTDELREITIEHGVSATAEGSARVTIGETEVIVGVKMGVETPYPDTPEQGNLMVNAELLPLSSSKFESGPPSIRAIELSRVVDRGLRESNAVDRKKLCIEPGEKVWSVMIDVCTVNAAGNLLDAASLGALAALKDAKFPELSKDGAIDYKTKSKKGLPLQREPIAITVFKIGEHFVVDPLPEEEEVCDARLTITVEKTGDVCSLQKGGEATLSLEEVDKMVDLAQKKAKEMRTIIK